MTILAQFNDCHCCNDARSLVQKKSPLYEFSSQRDSSVNSWRKRRLCSTVYGSPVACLVQTRALIMGQSGWIATQICRACSLLRSLRMKSSQPVDVCSTNSGQRTPTSLVDKRLVTHGHCWTTQAPPLPPLKSCSFSKCRPLSLPLKG